jgi:hypothetical protein
MRHHLRMLERFLFDLVYEVVVSALLRKDRESDRRRAKGESAESYSP